MIEANLRQTLLQDGLVVVDDVVRPEHRAALLRSLDGVLRKYRPEAEPSADWDVPAFHQELIRFRRDVPALFGAMYDTLQNCLALQQIFSDPRILEVVSRLLDEDPAGLATSGLMLRMDPPFDERNSLAWHQEASYYTQNLEALNGLVVWTPLLEVTREMGPVEFCLQSHRYGLYGMEHRQKADAQTSEQFRVSDATVARFSPVAPLLRPGSIVAFTMHTLHRSGKNESEFIRFAAGARYHKIFARDFLPGRVQYKPNLQVGRLSDRVE